MPSDAVTLFVSAGIGVGVIAGILSGICYVLAHGLKGETRSNKLKQQWHCSVCGSYFRSIKGILDNEKVVTCIRCEERVCRKRCSKFFKKGWICRTCFKKLKTYNVMQPKCKKLLFRLRNEMNFDKIQEIDEDIQEIRKKEKEQVRNFVERLVASILGGSVDDASVKRIYDNERYNMLFEKYHEDLSSALTELGSALHISIANLPVSGQSPCTAHSKVKKIIQKIIKDAGHLPYLNTPVEDSSMRSEDENRMYEDLLATAILNKVVSNYQNNLPSQSAESVSSRLSVPRSTTSSRSSRKRFFDEDEVDGRFHPTELESASVSSIEDWLHSDSSIGSTKFVDRVSLTIQQRIEEVNPNDSDDELIDDSEYFRTSSSFSNDDSNWRLQKRRLHDTYSPVPVPMFVPNPTTQAKVLIGDKEADETSDLSDAASDYGEIDSTSGVQNLIVSSKMVIGGKNPLNDVSCNGLWDEESSEDSGVKEDRSEVIEDEKYGVEEISLNSTDSKTEKDTECVEKYFTFPRTVKDVTPDSNRISVSETPTQVIQKEDNKKAEEDHEDETFEGAYSKKEKEKWKHPVAMKNNPYSKENIEKRIESNRGFGRDYYTRQAAAPSGTKKPDEHRNDWSWITTEETEEDSMYRAVPVITDNEESIQQVIKETFKDTEECNASEVTSDSDLSLVHTYDVENSKVYSEDLITWTKINDQPEPDKQKESAEDGKTTWVKVNAHGLLHNQEDQEKIEENDTKTWVKVNTEGLLHHPKEQEHVTKEDNRKSWVQESLLQDKTDGEVQESTETDNVHDEMPSLNEEYKKLWFKVNTDSQETPYLKKQTSYSEINRDENFNVEDEEIIPKAKPRRFLSVPIPQKRFNKMGEISDTNRVTTTTINGDLPKIINKKSDNTLIKKIYSDPVVRSFALTNREQIPVSTYETSPIKPEPPKPAIEVKNEVIFERPITPEEPLYFEKAVTPEPPSIPPPEVPSECSFSLVFSDAESRNISFEPEISELKEKQLVANLLGEFSKSFPNLTIISKKDISVTEPKPVTINKSEVNLSDATSEIAFVSVKDLKMRFEKNDESFNKDKPVHSLTARSISKQMRDELKSYPTSNSLSSLE